MKNSCISYPERESLIIIRKSQVEFCNGNVCAAALMSFFEYWHNIKLDMSPKNAQMNNVALTNGQPACHDESLYQFHTMDELSTGIMGIYKRDAITSARKLLKELGIISEHRNPSDRYKFDNTIYYLFHPEIFIQWLSTRYNVKPSYQYTENLQQSSENRLQSTEKRRPESEKRGTITETTTEISIETTTDIKTRAKAQSQPKNNPLDILLKAGVNEELAIEFIQLRKNKRALITHTVINGIAKEAEKAGITLSEAIAYCIIKNWQSFNAAWYQQANTNSAMTFKERDEERERDRRRKLSEAASSMDFGEGLDDNGYPIPGYDKFAIPGECFVYDDSTPF